jgi:hypothetical protein
LDFGLGPGEGSRPAATTAEAREKILHFFRWNRVSKMWTLLKSLPVMCVCLDLRFWIDKIVEYPCGLKIRKHFEQYGICLNQTKSSIEFHLYEHKKERYKSWKTKNALTWSAWKITYSFGSKIISWGSLWKIGYPKHRNEKKKLEPVWDKGILQKSVHFHKESVETGKISVFQRGPWSCISFAIFT